ncbi:MAG: helix-turn-helix transcriptional regulator, partial [Gammaproteobacteria bacterium]|nr:helix-turn-helix transcriptional regulator [Gammaproteobacteria bacterium]
MEMGLTVEEVAVSLKLGADVIEDLEAGDYSRLAGPTFVKGYMRSYARLLHLDEDDLVGRVELEPEPALITGIGSGKETTGRRFRFRPRPRPRAWRRKSGNSALRRVLVLLVLGGLVAGGLTLLPRFGFDRISDLVPIDEFQRYKTHPKIRPFFEG